MSDIQGDAAAKDAFGRRSFLAGIAAAPAFSWALRAGEARAEDPSTERADPSGLIVRELEPQNLESPFPALDGFLTPNARFYVRNHFAVPALDAKGWELTVEGAVDHPFRIGLEELKKMPSRTAPATLECAGNGRVSLVPKERGMQWGPGAVGTAEWTGVPLADLLERAGVRAGALEVILEGADEGEVKDEPKSPGPIRFARSLPMAKARAPEVLLAYKMNGEDLSPSHGSPLRAVVPGWYGVASVKWLTRLIVANRPFRGFFQSLEYTRWERVDGQPTMVPVAEMQLKAQVARPAAFEVVPAGRDYRIHGAAWSGDAEVAKVEVSTDGGKSWDEARLIGDATRFAWRLWEYSWKSPRKGPAEVMARATDAAGNSQPTKRDRDRRNYMISHVLPIKVEVR